MTWLQSDRLSELLRGASSVALFGSRASNCARAESDWDFLCIGESRSKKERGLDLVWVNPAVVCSGMWLSTDLAGHVAAFGVWIKGEPSWKIGDVDFSAAARRKEANIARTVRALAPAWDLLGPAYQAKHATLLRREVQRWALLSLGDAVAPAAALDAKWARAPLPWIVDFLVGMSVQRELIARILVAGSI